MEPDDDPGALRIGELSRRVGVSDHVLRAWESRYGLLRPVRSQGGFRLYTESDEGRVRRMKSHLARGLSAAEAAHATIAEEHTISTLGVLRGSEGAHSVGIVNEQSDRLRRALDDFDEPAAQLVLDRLLSEYTLATVLRDVVLRYLHELGERWERGDVTVAQEHFASNVLRGTTSGPCPRLGKRAAGRLWSLPARLGSCTISRS